MPAPELSKSRFGHFNALLRSGMQAFTYRNGAPNLLGLAKPAAYGLRGQKTPASETYLYRYLATADGSYEKQVESEYSDLNPGDEAATAAGKSTSTPAEKTPTAVPAQKTNNKTFVDDEVTHTEAAMASDTEAAGVLSQFAIIDLGIANPVPSFSSKITQQRSLKNAADPREKPIEPVSPQQPAVMDDIGNGLALINDKLQRTTVDRTTSLDAPPFVDHKKTLGSNDRPMVDRAAAEDLDANKPRPEHPVIHQAISAANKSISTHQQFVQLYQTIMENSSVSSRFKVDEKTRAAMNRMQESAPIEAVEAQPASQANKPLPIDTVAETGKSNPIITKQRGVNTQLETRFQQVKKYPSQGLPNIKSEAELRQSKVSELVREFDVKFSALEQKVTELTHTNNRLREKIARLESRQAKTLVNGPNRDRGTMADSFLERNRLTHAFIRMRS